MLDKLAAPIALSLGGAALVVGLPAPQQPVCQQQGELVRFLPVPELRPILPAQFDWPLADRQRLVVEQEPQQTTETTDEGGSRLRARRHRHKRHR